MQSEEGNDSIIQTGLPTLNDVRKYTDGPVIFAKILAQLDNETKLGNVITLNSSPIDTIRRY